MLPNAVVLRAPKVSRSARILPRFFGAGKRGAGVSRPGRDGAPTGRPGRPAPALAATERRPVGTGVSRSGRDGALTGRPGRPAPALAAFGERGLPERFCFFIWLKCCFSSAFGRRLLRRGTNSCTHAFSSRQVRCPKRASFMTGQGAPLAAASDVPAALAALRAPSVADTSPARSPPPPPLSGGYYVPARFRARPEMTLQWGGSGL